MRIYIYWPHPHRGPSPLCLAMLRPGDHLTVQALGSLHGETFAPVDEYEVVRDLPDPTALRRDGLGRFTARPSIALGRMRERRGLVRAGRFDVAHLRQLDYQFNWIDLPGLARSSALVSQVNDVRPHHAAFPRPVETRLLRATYESAGHLIVYHQHLADELVADFGIDAALVHTVPIPVVPVRSDDAERPRTGRPLVLVFGALRANKGLDVFLDALESIGPDRSFDVVIAGKANDEIHRMLRDRSTALGVQLEQGFVSTERKRELHAMASCIVLPYTRFHSQSGVLADAYAYRTPVIVSDVAALGASVREDGTGLVVPPADAEALAEALVHLPSAEDPDYATALDAVAARSSPESVGARLRDIFEIAVADRR